MAVLLESECGSGMFSGGPQMVSGSRSRKRHFRCKSALNVANYETCARSSK